VTQPNEIPALKGDSMDLHSEAVVDWKSRAEEAERRLAIAREELRKIAELGPEENKRLRKHGYVFTRTFMRGVPTEEAAKWEHLAFWLHADLWDAANTAERIIAEIEEPNV
jgi:hypothetical protein